jgi:predicted metal-dependent hydrolase
MRNVFEIVRRNVRLAYKPERAKRWTTLPRSVEDCINALSFLFPAGEAFFCRSVAYYRDRITDPVLREQVAQFIHQEAMHSKEHHRSNTVLRQADVLGAELETASRVLVWMSETFCHPATRLAQTCALEHFTVMLSETLLKDRFLHQEGIDPDFRNLWLWHAAEEIEHKSVCFDVYEHVFGSGFSAWLHRVVAMILVTVCTGWGVMLALTVASLKGMHRRVAEPKQASSQDHLKNSGFALVVSWMSLRAYLDFFRRDFHPAKRDHRELLEVWKQEHPGFGLKQANATA